MRGKGFCTGVVQHWCRITPAYAGKSRTAACSLPLPWDHPRLCGEKFDQMCFAGRDPGSPPPMRGKAEIPYFAACFTRITPAYAGKRNGIHLNMSCCWDHPRLCGEKFIPPCPCLTQWGSPPPMRGKAQPQVAKNVVERITPAYAGKSYAKKTS